MAQCEYGEICGCYPDLKERMPYTAEMIRKRYCAGKFGDCARFLLYSAVGMGKVPSDLFPGQTERAEMLLKMEDVLVPLPTVVPAAIRNGAEEEARPR
jgi:hypothetical protein